MKEIGVGFRSASSEMDVIGMILRPIQHVLILNHWR
jgi:hypothetical protein